MPSLETLPSITGPRLRWIRRRDMVTALVTNFVQLGAFVFVVVEVASGRLPSAYAVAAFAVTFVLNIIGLEVGYHRYFAHRTFKTTRWLALGLAILGSMSFQGGVIWWTATHRRHHRHTDESGDPHSPVLHGTSKWWNRLFAIWGAHIGWVFDHHRFKPAGWERWGLDLFRDRALFRIHSNYWKWGLLGLALPALLGAFIGQAGVQGAWEGLLWGGLLRAFVVNQIMYSTNSLCHLVGTRSFRTRDNSRNLSVLAGPTFGLFLHNNHHAFPGCAQLGFHWWQIDPSGAVIRMLEATGLAWDVRRASPAQIQHKLAKRS